MLQELPPGSKEKTGGWGGGHFLVHLARLSSWRPGFIFGGGSFIEPKSGGKIPHKRKGILWCVVPELDPFQAKKPENSFRWFFL